MNLAIRAWDYVSNLVCPPPQQGVGSIEICRQGVEHTYSDQPTAFQCNHCHGNLTKVVQVNGSYQHTARENILALVHHNTIERFHPVCLDEIAWRDATISANSLWKDSLIPLIKVVICIAVAILISCHPWAENKNLRQYTCSLIVSPLFENIYKLCCLKNYVMRPSRDMQEELNHSYSNLFVIRKGTKLGSKEYFRPDPNEQNQIESSLMSEINLVNEDGTAGCDLVIHHSPTDLKPYHLQSLHELQEWKKANQNADLCKCFVCQRPQNLKGISTPHNFKLPSRKTIVQAFVEIFLATLLLFSAIKALLASQKIYQEIANWHWPVLKPMNFQLIWDIDTFKHEFSVAMLIKCITLPIFALFTFTIITLIIEQRLFGGQKQRFSNLLQNGYNPNQPLPPQLLGAQG